MITYCIWKTVDTFELFDIFVAIFFSIFIIWLDLILLPIEVIAFIVYKILNKED